MTWLDLADDLTQFVLTAVPEQVANGLRHALENERNQQHRQPSDIEHPLPAIALDQLLGGQRHEDAAHRVTGKHQGDQAGAQFQW
ncbi:hypothetical protein D3C75_1280690 [compost metagenome]